MSWQTYIDNLEGGPGKCAYAAVAGTDPSGVSIWAESMKKDKFALSSVELTRIVKILSDKSDNSDIFAQGMEINGVKFAVVILDEDSLVLQGKGDHKDLSFVASIAGKSCVIGVNPDKDVKTPHVRNGVETIRDHLKNAGF